MGPFSAIISQSRVSSGFIGDASLNGLSPGAANENDPCGNERQRQKHPHGRAADEKAKLRVGLAEKFACYARERISQGKKPCKETRPRKSAELDCKTQREEQNKPFEPRLIKLAWM